MHTLKVLVTIIILTVSIIGAGLYSYNKLCDAVTELEQEVLAIETSTLDLDWTNAESRLDTLQNKWAQVQYVWSMFTDHYHIDAISTNIARVSQFIKTKNQSMALAELASLQQLIKSIPENEAFDIKNIL